MKNLLEQRAFMQFARKIGPLFKKHPGHPELLNLKRMYVISDYRNNYESALASPALKNVFLIAPDIRNCKAGALNENALMMIKNHMLYLRRLAGLTDTVVFREDWNSMAQQAALMMHAADRLSHQPGRSWSCYTKEGAMAASRGNLSLGTAMLHALDAQILDNGAGNEMCGHRRWILNPENRVFGFGSTGNAACLMVFGHEGKQPISNTGFTKDQFITWPAEDFFPYELMPARWSFSLSKADFSDARVSLIQDGRKIQIKKEKPNDGYGINTLVWTPLMKLKAGKVCAVKIERVKIGGVMKNYSYQITPVQASSE